jgi:hypothetical protein
MSSKVQAHVWTEIQVFKLAFGLTYKLAHQYKNLRHQKIALIKALQMQMMLNIYILLTSGEINEASY